MALFAIGDLHLASGVSKPMIFFPAGKTMWLVWKDIGGG